MEISNTQKKILSESVKNPQGDIRNFMKDFKSPAIKDKILQSLSNKGFIASKPSDNPNEQDKVYYITQSGIDFVKTTSETIKPIKNNKQSLIISMLKQANGATIDELISATNWQKHSLRGHLSNLKRINNLEIEVFLNSEGIRTYRLNETCQNNQSGSCE